MPFIGTTPRQGFSNHIASQNLSANVDGSTTVFTLSTAVASENDLEVFVGNVRQEPGSSKAYTASGTTLTFTEAPANGLNVYVNYKGQAQITSIPLDASITTQKLVDDAVTGTKLANDIAISTTGNITGTEVTNNNFMIDQWRINSGQNNGSNGDAIIGGSGVWERVDNQSYNNLVGTQMQEASGIFTFPRTGVYMVTFFGNLACKNGDTNPKIQIKVSTDADVGSPTYTAWSESSTGNAGSSNANILITTQVIINCDDVTKVKCSFHTKDFNTDTSIQGNTSHNLSYVTFERKGSAN